jgi:hypothetical protein
MDFEAIIDKECPAPIHWLTHRRYVIGRVKYEVEKRDARIAALESIVNNFDAFMAALAAIGPHAGKPDSHIEALLDKVKLVNELEAALKVLSAEVVRNAKDRAVGKHWDAEINDAVWENPIAAEAVREAAK